MNSFNSRLKEIRILELLAVALASIFLLGFFDLDINWIMIIILIYILFRTRDEFNGLKCSVDNVFSEISVKSWLLLIASSYIFALGSGLLFDDLIAGTGFYSILDGAVFFGSDLLYTVVLGPIVEELVFRGVFLHRLNNRLPLILGIILSSLLFALLHDYSAWVSSFVFGATLCIAYLLTDNIVVPVSIHMGNNLVSFIIGFTPNLELIFHSDLALIIIYVLSTLSLIYILRFWIISYRESISYW